MVWTVVGLYLLLVILLQIPAVQSFLGSTISGLAGEKLGTEVKVGKVNIGIFNRLIIDDVMIYDQQGKAMVRAGRLSAKVNLYELSKGKVVISSAQLFGLQGNFYRKDSASPVNFQFALDSLASKDTTHTPLDIHIGSLIIRRGSINYDQLDMPITPRQFSPNHLHVSDLSAHILLPYLTEDSVETLVKRLSLKESSGLDVQGLSFHLRANKEQARINELTFKLPRTQININAIDAAYSFKNDKIEMATLTFNGDISESRITPCDIACFDASLQSFTNPLTLSTSFSGTSTMLTIDRLLASSEQGNFNLKGSGSMSHIGSTPKWAAKIDDLQISHHTIDFISKNLQGKKADIPEEITRLGNVTFKGQVGGVGVRELSLKGSLNTDAGNALLGIALHDQHFTAQVKASELDLHRILDDNHFGKLSANLDANGQINAGKIPLVSLKGNVFKFDYNNYSYNDLSIDGIYQKSTFDGHLTLHDPNGDIDMSGMFYLNGEQSKANLIGTVRHLNLGKLKLSDPFEGKTFEADIDADFTGNSLNNMNGVLDISNLIVQSGEESYKLEKLHLTAANEGNERYLSMQSDFADIDLIGQYDYASLPQSIINFIGSKLPTLPGLPKTNNINKNNFSIKATVIKSDWLNTFFNIPVTLMAPLHLEGSVNDHVQKMDMTVNIPAFFYDGGAYENGIVSLRTSDVDELIMSSHLRKIMDNGQRFDINLNANAANNELITSLNWNNNQLHPMQGTINSTTEFFTSEEGNHVAHMRIHPSNILVNDTIWRVQPSDILYSEKNLLVDYFAIVHNKQHIIVSGRATDQPTDSIVADLQDVDVSYILNLVNFHAVDFSGKASGKACVKSVFKDPDAHADLTVGQFRFQNGRMGTLYAKAGWNKEKEQIDIDAQAIDEGDARTIIKGYVSPTHNFIDLGITADNTRLEFLEDFCDSFMANVEARGVGDLRLAGDLDDINLTGMVVANGRLDITTLNTRYTMHNDTVRLIPDEIILRADTVRDRNGNIGIVNGALHHKSLTQLTFDIDVRAENLLCYDFPDYGDNTFYGTVYATGNCMITGRNGRIDFDVNGTPEKGSFIEYNAASPDAISKQEFIIWRDRSSLLEREEGNVWTGDGEGWKENISATAQLDSVGYSVPRSSFDTIQEDIPTDLHINFLINATPDFTLRVLMDQASGDYIALNGTGALRATYYNKGSFDMFGNYLVDNGTYKLTIQNIIKKDFLFQQGGSIVFGGDPYNAALNLKAIYTINGVPLSDLQIGQSFRSNNVRVDCIMNINGTPQTPTVEFDLDLPTVNTDAKQMIRPLINGEEEMNQQVIYLLGIGRFYTQNMNNADENESQSQTSLAMQSLLSGTISQQINSVLGSLVKSSNWNFGANISTGTEGWNNAEYEGLLSGRLLNNRLLINGQFGYRDNANATTSFIGDFDIRYLLYPSGNLAIRVYNQTNDRYFTRNSLTTQGLGLILKKDFNEWNDLFRKSRKN